MLLRNLKVQPPTGRTEGGFTDWAFKIWVKFEKTTKIGSKQELLDVKA